MRRYVYTRPLIKVSTSPIHIKDGHDHPVGSIQRTFKSSFFRACSWVIDSWELSVEGKDERTGEEVKLYDNRVWFSRNSWTVTVQDNDKVQRGILRDQSKAITTPRFHLRIEDQEYEVSRELLSRSTRFIHVHHNHLVCEIEHHVASGYMKRQMHVHDESLSPILLGSIDHLIKTMY